MTDKIFELAVTVRMYSIYNILRMRIRKLQIFHVVKLVYNDANLLPEDFFYKLVCVCIIFLFSNSYPIIQKG